MRDHSPSTSGAVVLFPNREYTSKHEAAVFEELAKKLAALKGYAFAGRYDSTVRYPGHLYFVPTATVTDCQTARRLGIHDESDLFGGVVPYPCVATKAITHPLIAVNAVAPPGWSHAFPWRVKHVTLFGFSAFTFRDARRAAALVLERGAARVKPANGVGGRGQTVVFTIDELDAALAAIGEENISQHGVTVEQNLVRVTTFSVGQLRLSNLLASYYGKQCSTKDSQGLDAYGGSELVVVRGDYDRLIKLVLSPEVRVAIDQAVAYDAAAEEFPGFMASRRNYDVAQGLDGEGRRCSGVLEQSWRIGGASAAEIAALEAFRADSTLDAVRASCVEAYGEHEAPPNAVLNFRGIDDRVGAITKYTIVETDANRR
jgi:hypothetical protein